MNTLYTCANDGCKNYVLEHGDICPDCQAEARRLQANIRIEDTEQFIRKNEGLKRHIKSHWKGRK